MPDTPASLAACREAEQDAELDLQDARHACEEARSELAPWAAATNALNAFNAALASYRAAVAARVRAELLQSGTPVWVATDKRARVSQLYRNDPQMTDGVAMNDDEDDGLWLWEHPALCESGTCVEARVILQPEGE